MASSLVISTADHRTAKAQQTTFTGVNPNAKDADLKTFATMTADLSKDLYVKAERVDKTDLDNLKPQRPTPLIRVLSQNVENNSIRIGFSQLTYNPSNGIFTIGPNVSTGLTNNQIPTVTPEIVDVSSSNPDVSYKIGSFTWYSNNMNLWYFTAGPVASSATDKKETTITFKVHYPAGDGFADYTTPTITVEIYDDTL